MGKFKMARDAIDNWSSTQVRSDFSEEDFIRIHRLQEATNRFCSTILQKSIEDFGDTSVADDILVYAVMRLMELGKPIYYPGYVDDTNTGERRFERILDPRDVEILNT